MDEQGAASSEAIGPEAAATRALEVNAVPDDGGAAASGPRPADPTKPPGYGTPGWLEWEGALTIGIGMSFDILASRWQSFVTPADQRKALVDVWTPVCVKYWPGGIPPVLAAVICTGMVVGPKMVGAMREERARKAAARARRPSAESATETTASAS